MENIEKTILTNLLKDKNNFKLLQDRKIEATYFQFPDSRKLFEICEYYFLKNNRSLEGDSLQSILRQSTKLGDELKSKLGVLHAEVMDLNKSSDFNVDLDEFAQYYKINRGRRLLQIAQEHLHAKDPDKFLDTLKSSLIKLNFNLNSSAIESHFFGENAEDIIFKYYDKKKHPEKYSGVKWGFKSLDNITNGSKPGQVILVIGEMKSGKSVFMVNIAHNMMTAGKRVYYHANEGGLDLIEERLISCGTGIEMDNIEFNRMDSIEEQKYEQYLRSFRGKDKLFIESVPSFFSSASHIEGVIMELQTLNTPPDIVLVDYLGLMQTDDKTIKSSWEKLGAITMELKSVSMKTKVPIVVIGHVNRRGMEKDSNSFDLADMGLSLEPLKHVDMILSWKINDPDAFAVDKKGEGTLKVIGARSSKYTEVTLQIDTNKMKIYEMNLGIKH